MTDYSYSHMAQQCRKLATECKNDNFADLKNKFDALATEFNDKTETVATENDVTRIILQRIEKINDIASFWKLKSEKYDLELVELVELVELEKAKSPEEIQGLKEIIKKTKNDCKKAKEFVNELEGKVQELANKASQTYEDISKDLEQCVIKNNCCQSECEKFKVLIRDYLLAEYKRYQDFLEKNC
jgi:SMC interacting uncharacterized protein involved in chromosome segregation